MFNGFTPLSSRLTSFLMEKRWMDGRKEDGTCFHPPCIYLQVESRETGREVYFQRGPPACGRLLDETRPILRFFFFFFLFPSELDSRLSP